MGYLDIYTSPLTEKTASHLLRRATFGPTQQEITSLTGMTATQAVDLLISNASYRATPPPPVELEAGRSDSGQPFLTKPFTSARVAAYNSYIQFWWIGLMTEQTGRPSVLDKLTAFWQNHFVVAFSAVEDYRLIDRYLRLLRLNALGNFREMTIGVTKDPAMLMYQNGNENEKEHPNENYGRELQELFTVGQKDFAGNHNYTEQDVKEAARVLTGWQVVNSFKEGSTTFGSTFNPDRHDTSEKNFSSFYNNKTITGRAGQAAGDEELVDLVNMLLGHQETPKFICRKLYRWYVNPNVTQEIEDQVIIPLANFFASPENNFAIAPVLKKLLTSEIFYDVRNIGAIVKSPAEFMIGAVRMFDLPVPDLTTEYGPFRIMMNYLNNSMTVLQLNFLNQPSVFGSLPYYQTGYSKNWINGTTLGLRGARTDAFTDPWLEIKPGYLLGVDLLKRLRSIQPNFSDVANTPGITCEQVLKELTRNLFSTELSQTQQDFLIDNIMMMNNSARGTWVREWNAYRTAPTEYPRQTAVLVRCKALMKHMLRMAEYQLF
ncbi:DUF1800 domain-containing protein [Dyadobacter chenwenxiniae]|uniref:DUF1800 domain-containing protein n=1 Tax=Dyadobacter chenwenxiniae TaxID=2906456 RepID=A0A9X1TG95_9BACT|nr:DUF1800 domain-containing protein [Dyadobacter chenwenxiniae]MCF0063852.1 DUF1800 domain-containing protein [Dyadobacter chenwenxiniae]UON83528.1 DUF1800 domain-containing protein [Dyadobacter chenwenxiniae]